MKQIINFTILFLLLIITISGFSQTTIWAEDFSGLSDGTTSVTGSTANWSANTTSSKFSVQNNVYRTNNFTGTWTSEDINISNFTNVIISVDF